MVLIELKNDSFVENELKTKVINARKMILNMNVCLVVEHTKISFFFQFSAIIMAKTEQKRTSFVF